MDVFYNYTITSVNIVFKGNFILSLLLSPFNFKCNNFFKLSSIHTKRKFIHNSANRFSYQHQFLLKTQKHLAPHPRGHFLILTCLLKI